MISYYNFISDEEYERAAANGINKDVFRCRVARGWDRERAMTEPLHERKSPYCKTLVNLAAACGVDRMTLYTRVKVYGMSPYKAATTPKKVKKKSIYYRPDVFASCTKLGISENAFKWRINYGGWSLERAMTEPKKLRAGIY